MDEGASTGGRHTGVKRGTRKTRDGNAKDARKLVHTRRARRNFRNRKYHTLSTLGGNKYWIPH